jgi:transposase InsO family protein
LRILEADILRFNGFSDSESEILKPRWLLSAFALDCCDREAVGHVATTEGIKGEDVRDLMVAAVEQRFGPINRLPATIEWLTDNGSCYIAGETRKFAREIESLTRNFWNIAILWPSQRLRALATS